MIFAFIRSSIGSIGRALMDFYIANSFVINGLILLYAFVVFVSQRIYLQILQRIFISLNIIKSDEKAKVIRKVGAADFAAISWPEIRKGIWFPFISAPGKWTFSLFSNKYLETEFTLEKINSFIKIAEKEK
jgi:hypothetical protein